MFRTQQETDPHERAICWAETTLDIQAVARQHT